MPGDRSVSLWEDPFSCASKKTRLALTEQDKNILRRLHQGERGKGIGLERMNGALPNVVTVRVNKKRRLFLWMYDTSIVVIHIMTNHKHNRVPSHVYEFMFGVPFDPDKDNNLTYASTDDLPVNFTPDPHFQLKEIKKAVCYHQSLIVYDENQNNVLNATLPALLHGDFGSGKSALMITTFINAILSLKDVHPDKHFVYYSHLAGLVRHMFDMLLLDNPDLATVIDMNRIKFLDTLGFVREYGPTDLKDKEAVGIDAFKRFISEQLKRDKSDFLRGIDSQADGDSLYDEFQIIATLPGSQAYLSLGAGASNYSQPDMRAWMLEVTQLYLKHMLNGNQFDPCITLWETKKEPLALFVGDEMQGAPLSMVIMPTRLTHNRNIMLCGDANQNDNRRLSVFPRTKEIFSQAGSPLNVCSISGSYRSPTYLMPLINSVMAMKQYINHGLNDKHQSPEVSSQSMVVDKGSINYVPLSSLDKLKAKLNQGAMVVVITPQAFVLEAKKEFGDDVPIYTPEGSRGMEFLNVVHYKLMQKPLPLSEKNKQAKPRILAELINHEIIGMPDDFTPAKHQPKAGKANARYETEINDWIIAYSRVKNGGHCYVVEEDKNPRAARLRERVKAAIMRGQALTSDNDESLAEGTKAEWEAFAIKNIELGNHEQALVAYKRLGKSEAELNQAIQARHQAKQDRIDRALSRPSPAASGNKPKVVALKRNMSDELNALINAEDKITALSEAMKRYTNAEWLAPVTNGHLFFLAMIHHEALAEAFFRLMLIGEKAFFDNFFEKIATKINWLNSKNESEGVYFTWLHWMVEDKTRFMIFKNIVEKAGDRSLSGFGHKQASSLLLAYDSQSAMKTRLPLGAVIAIKNINLFALLCKKHPAAVSPMTQALLTTFSIDGKETNVICHLLDAFSEEPLRQLDSVLREKSNGILDRMIGFGGAKCYTGQLEMSAIAWCVSQPFRDTAYSVMNQFAGRVYNFNELSGLLESEHAIGLLTTGMYNQKTFFKNLMVKKNTRDFVFHWMTLFKASSKIFSEVDFGLNNMVESGSDRLPLIFAIYRSQYREFLLTELENGNAEHLYQESIGKAHWVTPYRVTELNAEIPLLYLMAKDCSSRLSVVLSGGWLDFMSADYWLHDWHVGGAEPQSILFLLLEHLAINGKELTQEQLSYLYDSLILLLSANQGALLKAYLGYYYGRREALPESIHEAINPRVLFDVCFYLAAQLNGHTILVIKEYADLILNAISIADLFGRTSIRLTDMPLFYSVVNHKFLLEKLKNRFERLSPIERRVHEVDLYRALVKKQINDDDRERCSWNALARLASTKVGADFLCDLMGLFPELAESLIVEDFDHPDEEEGAPYSDTALRILLDHPKQFNRFYECMQENNPSLASHLDGMLAISSEDEADTREMVALSDDEDDALSDFSDDSSKIDTASFEETFEVDGTLEASVSSEGDTPSDSSDSSKENKPATPQSMSALQQLSLFSAPIGTGSPAAPASNVRRRLVFDF